MKAEIVSRFKVNSMIFNELVKAMSLVIVELNDLDYFVKNQQEDWVNTNNKCWVSKDYK